MKEEDVNYTCQVPCQQIAYEPVLSYSHLLKLSFPDKLSKERQSKVNDDYVHAREVARRVDRDLAEEELEIINNMKNKTSTYLRYIDLFKMWLDSFNSSWTNIFKTMNASYNIFQPREEANLQIKQFGSYVKNALFARDWLYREHHHYSDICINMASRQNTHTNVTTDDKKYKYCEMFFTQIEFVIRYIKDDTGSASKIAKTVLKTYIDDQGHLLKSIDDWSDDHAYVTCMNKRLDLNGSWALHLEEAYVACELYLWSSTSNATIRIQMITNIVDSLEWIKSNISEYKDLGCSLPDQETWEKIREINQQFKLAIQKNIHDAVYSWLLSSRLSFENGLNLLNSMYRSYQKGNEVNTTKNGYSYSDLLQETLNNITIVHKEGSTLTRQYIETLENFLSLEDVPGHILPLQEIWERYIDEEITMGYSQTKQDLKPLHSVLSEVDKELSGLQKMIVERLEKYAKENFTDYFMDNFIKMDIFYRSLSYEEITQQKAFEFLSLFGEIGGFLGLLLGASVLTVFELLDYLAVVALKKCKASNDFFSVKN